MGMQVNTNISALNSYRNLSNTQNDLAKSLEKLSSGLRINHAADDAAGLAISQGLQSQVGGLTVASRNAQDGISVIQTAEGSLSEVQTILQRVRDLAVQAGNDSNSATSRGAITTEVSELSKELTRISGSTNFNGTNLLDGSKSSLNFQVGANGDAASQIAVNLGSANVKAIADKLTGGDLSTTGTSFSIADITKLAGVATFTSSNGGQSTTVKTGNLGASFTSVEGYASALRSDAAFSANYSVSVSKDANGAGTGIVVTALNGGTLATADNTTAGSGLGAGNAGTAVTGGVQFDTAANAQASIKLIDTQIATVSTARATLGAAQNRFESVIRNLAVSTENLTAAKSRITDTDMASEMVKYTRSNILSQAGTAMLAQANQGNQGVLQLLR